MKSPPKEKPPRGGKGLRTNMTVYHITAFLAKVFEKPFWFFEQKRASLLDQIDNERGDE